MFKKILKELGLEFSDESLELEFQEIHMESRMISQQTISFIVLSSILLISIISWKKLGRMRRYIFFVTSSAFLVLGIIAIQNYTENSQIDDYFYKGYGYAIYYCLVLVPIDGFYLRIAFAVFSIVTKFWVIVPGDVFSGVLVGLLDLIFLGRQIMKEQEARENFGKIVAHREELESFKNLVMNHIPSNILVFKGSLENVIITNKAFNREFGTTPGNPTNNYKAVLSTLNVDVLSEAVKSSDTILTRAHLGSKTDVQSLDQFVDLCVNNSCGFDGAVQAISNDDDEKRIYEVKLIPITWLGQNARALIMNDITIQESLTVVRLSDENKLRVIASISHEIRTPIHGILGALQALMKVSLDRITKEAFDITYLNANLLLHIVNNIIDYQSIINNKIVLKLKKVNLSQVFKDIHDLYDFQCQLKGLKFVINMNPDLPKEITTDKSRLEQILVSLLNNAVKFTYSGKITVTVANDPSDLTQLMISVADTGVGIDEESKKSLFKFFGKYEHVDSVSAHGVGLGLTIASSLVKLLCPDYLGDTPIKLLSKVGEGSTFVFKISRHIKDNDNENSSLVEIEEYYFPQKGYKYGINQLRNTKPNTPNEYLSRNPSTSHIMLSQNPSFIEKFNGNYSPLPSENRNLKEKENDFSKFDKKILIVDDHSFNIIVANKLLIDKGFKTASVLNGKLAIEELSANSKDFGLILMDLQMPVMDGFEATKILTTMMDQREIPTIPIIALSANDGPIERARCQELGMKGFLSKPLNMRAFDDELIKIGIQPNEKNL